MRDASSGMFDVADPSGSVSMRSPSWVSGWHAPLLKLTKASIVPNRDDTHTLHRLIDDLFTQFQERLASGVDGPAAFRTLLTDVTDYFEPLAKRSSIRDPAKVGVPSGTPFSNYLRSFRVVCREYSRQRWTPCAITRDGDGTNPYSYRAAVPDADANLLSRVF